MDERDESARAEGKHDENGDADLPPEYRLDGRPGVKHISVCIEMLTRELPALAAALAQAERRREEDGKLPEP